MTCDNIAVTSNGDLWWPRKLLFLETLGTYSYSFIIVALNASLWIYVEFDVVFAANLGVISDLWQK